MYFLDGRSQEDIARVLETSRSNVSRMLSAARLAGIVEIRIQDDEGRDTDLEQALSERFGLIHVRVARFRPHQDTRAGVANLAAEWLERTLQNGHVLALAWGSTLQAVVEATPPAQRPGVEVVPLVGGLAAAESLVAGQALVEELAGRLGATYRHLYAPALLRSAAARDALLDEPSIAQVIARARAADVALVGIGTVGVGSTIEVLDGLGLSSVERAQFLAQNPVGDTCCRFFDATGRPIEGAVRDRVLAVELDDLRRIPTVVGVATGATKTAGVLAALRGGIVDGLIVDACLAHSVLTADGLL
jgi:DNA-binding transcriptional regulator LsrR (DeoR family)